jgi:hypothetical protein
MRRSPLQPPRRCARGSSFPLIYIGLAEFMIYTDLAVLPALWQPAAAHPFLPALSLSQRCVEVAVILALTAPAETSNYGALRGACSARRG